VSEPQAIPIICGPTGAGKTAIALELAEQYPIEIISADSRQVVRHLDIGTAKPTQLERGNVNFHLIDIIEPGERYTAFRFIEDAGRAVEDILGRDRIPIVVGGTGLYLRALTEGVVEIEMDDLTIREQLENEMEQLGAGKMYERLMQIDPLEAAKLHPHNKVRVIRALEIFSLTGKTKSELTATGAYRKSGYDFEYYCFIPEREALYSAVDNRVDMMMQRGLLDEIKHLCRNGFKERLRKANVIGYNELMDYLDGRTTLAEAVSLIKQNSRRYAKRQITWFKNQITGTFFANRMDIENAAQQLLSLWRR
jgi:tRNA dimethylallyltransferase